MSTKSKRTDRKFGIRHLARKQHANAIVEATGRKPVKWHPHKV